MKRIIALLAIAIFTFTTLQTKASHLAAGEIYYVHVTGLTYVVHLKLYRDCSGIPIGPTASYCATAPDSNYNQGGTLDTNGANDPNNGKRFDGLCPGVPNFCANPASPYPAYDYFHYIDTITLPYKAKTWKFMYSSCCRNPNILNVAQDGTAIYAELHNLNRENSSVNFTKLPIPYVCINQFQTYINDPVDPDVDSLHIVGIVPQNTLNCAQGTSTNLNWVAPYNLANPINTLPSTPYTVNALTGNATFTPTLLGIFVLAFRAYDIDALTGDTVGSMMRDVQINVTPCAAAPAPISSNIIPCSASPGYIVDPLDTNNTHILVCPGIPMCFTVHAQSTSASNVIYGYSNNLITAPGSSTSIFPPSGTSGTSDITFNWTASTAGNYPVTFTFVDSTCGTGQPIVLYSYKTVIITVLPGVSGGGPYNYCPGASPLQLSATGPVGTTSFTWSVIPGQPIGTQANFSNPNIANPTSIPSSTVDVVVTGLPVVSGCSNKDTVTLFVWPAFIVNAGPDLAPCANDPLCITETNNRPQGSTTVSWSPNIYVNSGLFDSTLCITPLTDITYVVKLVDNYGCIGLDTAAVKVKGVRPIVDAYPARDTLCIGEAVKLYANASPQPCGISSNICSGPTSFKTVGTGTVSNNVFSPFYRDFSAGYRAQYLFTAAELKAAGLSAGNIKGLTLLVDNAPANAGTDTLLGLRIKMGCTSLGSLSTSTGFIPGLSVVYGPSNNFSPALGTNDINFSATGTYFWDGKSNLIVEFCYNLPQFAGGSSATVISTGTPFVSALVDQDFANSGCNLPGNGFNASQGSLRPNFKFNFCKTREFLYTWTPASAFSGTNSTQENPIVNQGHIQGNTTFTVLVSGDSLNLCTTTDIINVAVDNSGSVIPSVNPAHICEPGLVTLNALPGPGTLPPSYACGEENFTIKNAPTTITTNPGGVLTMTSPFTGNTGGKTQMLYKAAELTAMGFTKGIITAVGLNVTSKFTTTPYSNWKISMSCTKDNVMTNYINAGSMKQVYQTPSVNTVLGWNTFTLQTPFLWDGTSNLIIEYCYGGHNIFQSDNIAAANVGFQASYGEGNGNSDGCSMPFGSTGFASTIPVNYRAQTQITIAEVNDKPFQYIWNPSLYVYDTTKAQTLAYVLNSTTYTVGIVNRTGCAKTDTVRVWLETHDVNIMPSDTELCSGDKVQLFAVGSGTGMAPTYFWYPNLSTEVINDTTIIVGPPASTIYYVVRTDEFGCKDTSQSDITILPSPNVSILNIGNVDTLPVLYGSTVNLVAGYAYSYSWSPTWGLTNSNSNNITISPTIDTKYYVIGVDTNGCKNYDSVYIKMINDNPVSLPTAFSPNGDGRNDKFQISNYKFEKIQEFRVFNRFGEEIYSGLDNSGWDGTYKGNKCEMETYQYIIRIAYPDSKVKVLKGDVLLVR
jgi:gliding motility-associated-like protein